MAEKLTLKIKLSYGITGIGDSCFYSVIGTFLMFFLTTVAGINPVTAGSIAAIGSIWDAALNPLIGHISDNAKSKYGRRLPFMFFAAFPLGVSCSMLFSSIDAGYGLKIAYYTALILVFWTSYSAFFIPYMALGAEITNDYDERTGLRSITYGFNIAGMVIGMVMPTLIVDFLMKRDASVEEAWKSAGVLVGAVSAVTIFLTCFALKNKLKNNYPPQNKNKNKNTKIKKEKKPFLREYLEVLKLKPLICLIGASISYLVANAMINSNRMYFMTFNLHFEASTITAVMLFCILSGAFFIPIVIGSSKRFDKRKVYIASMAIGATGLIFANFIGIHTIFGMCAFLLVYTCANSTYWQLMPALIYDVCEVDELVYGNRREGSVISLQALAEAAASATGMQLLGIILGLADFNGLSPVQAPNTLSWIGYALTIIPAVFMVISMIMILKYPITKSRFHQIMEALEKRKNGEKVDLEEMKYLF